MDQPQEASCGRGGLLCSAPSSHLAGVSLSPEVFESFVDYVAVEQLDGDNKYDAGEHGLQVIPQPAVSAARAWSECPLCPPTCWGPRLLSSSGCCTLRALSRSCKLAGRGVPQTTPRLNFSGDGPAETGLTAGWSDVDSVTLDLKWPGESGKGGSHPWPCPCTPGQGLLLLSLGATGHAFPTPPGPGCLCGIQGNCLAREWGPTSAVLAVQPW